MTFLGVTASGALPLGIRDEDLQLERDQNKGLQAKIHERDHKIKELESSLKIQNSKVDQVTAKKCKPQTNN